jgi:hypothetical protein
VHCVRARFVVVPAGPVETPRLGSWRSHLVLDLTNLLLDKLLRPGGPWCEGVTAAALSVYLSCTMLGNCCSKGCRADIRDVLSKRRNLAEVIHDNFCMKVRLKL